jgi:NAD(P)H-binding
MTNPRTLIATVKQAGVKRLLVVGGAGSPEVAPGVQLVDTPAFPPEYKPESLAGRDFLNVLRGEQELDWTFLSPLVLFVAGQRTGKFRLDTDRLLVGANGESKISFEDFAIALTREAATLPPAVYGRLLTLPGDGVSNRQALPTAWPAGARSRPGVRGCGPTRPRRGGRGWWRGQ